MIEPKDAKFDEMRILICELVDGTITSERRVKLNQILANDPEAVNHYIDFLDIQVLMKSNMSNIEKDFSVLLCSNETQELEELWCQLAKEEKTAPEIKIPRELQHRELIQRVVYPPREKRRLNKFSIITLLNAAAIILFFVFLRYAPYKGSTEVATLTDSIDAKWADSDVSTLPETRLWDNETLQLLRGVAKIQFDYGAEVIVEAPAEIELESPEKMTINYGRLFAHVSEQATGFTVDTPMSKVIDVGTEFGIEVGFAGNTDVHMFKGKASLVAGRKGEKKQGMELVAGQARTVAQTGQVREIHLEQEVFVRKLDSHAGLLWRGEALNLADVVGGGDGFGTGILNEGIDVVSGQPRRELRSQLPTAGVNQYVPVSDSKFIDGIFVVNNQEKEILVDSDGHYFNPGYKTEGLYWGYIVNGAFHQGDRVLRHTLRLDGQLCGTNENPAIGIHSNLGITFDLNEIREQIPGILIDKFFATAGISETVENIPKEHFGKADFWVLLDGEVKFSKRIHYLDGSSLIDVPVQPDDRFLTLIVTDAADHDNLSYDWAMFVNPVLELR